MSWLKISLLLILLVSPLFFTFTHWQIVKMPSDPPHDFIQALRTVDVSASIEPFISALLVQDTPARQFNDSLALVIASAAYFAIADSSFPEFITIHFQLVLHSVHHSILSFFSLLLT
jgi:hypothetical protein